MSLKINNLINESKQVTEKLGNFSVLEYVKDLSVAPDNAMAEYFMSKMNVRRRQVLINLDGSNTAVTQSGAMQWIAGNIVSTTGIKSAGDLLGKMVKGAVTNESAIKPEYKGKGIIALEPTYKYIILQDVSNWGKGLVVEDGMFLACDGLVKHNIVARSSFSSAIAGNEGLFNMSFSGQGVVALESYVPYNELVEVELDNDVLKIDGSFAVCWSASLDFTVERSSKTLIGSAFNGEGLVNVYKGTGKVLMSPVAPSYSLFSATHAKAPTLKDKVVKLDL